MKNNYPPGIRSKKAFILAKIITFFVTLKYRIFYKNRVKFGKNFLCNWKFTIKGKGKVIIGDNVNAWSSIWPVDNKKKTEFITQLPNAIIKIGNNCRLNGCTFFARKYIEVKNNVLIGTALIQDNDFHPITNGKFDMYSTENIKSKPIIINSNVWIGGECIILKGVTIGKKSIVGIRSVVRINIPSYSIAFGNPAFVVKKIIHEKENNMA